MAGKKKSSGLLKRPKTITGSGHIPKSLKPQQARQLIRRFHTLQKNKTNILNKLNRSLKLKEEKLSDSNYLEILKLNHRKLAGIYDKGFSSIDKVNIDVMMIQDTTSVNELVTKLGEIDGEIAKRGGLKTYQSASTQGQNSKRGGDSSKKLIEWLEESKYKDIIVSQKGNLNALEIGCLSVDNLISTSGIFSDIHRIDLNSQHPSILEQNFMERPLPTSTEEKFNLVSCSLVLNFVPSPIERGEMLERITKFLKPPSDGNQFSALFFVLPLPCVTNSRYLNNELFHSIMKSLGFELSCYHEANKVAYWLFDWLGGKRKMRKKFSKKELQKGNSRNNFAIIMK